MYLCALIILENMPSINVELAYKKNSDGRKSVYIRLTEGLKHKRISTGIKVFEKDFHPKAKYGKWIRTSDLSHEVHNQHLINKIKEVQEELFSAEGRIDAVAMKKSFIKYAEKEIETYRKQDKYRSAEKLKHVLNKLKGYVKSDELTFKAFNKSFLSNYEVYLRKDIKNHQNTIQTDLKRIKTVFYNAVKEGVIRPDQNPFIGFKIVGEVTKRDKLDATEIENIEKLDLKEGSFEWHVRNYFMFAFYCAGIRFGDFAVLKVKNIVNDRLEYTMSKIKGKPGSIRSVKLLPKAQAILKHYLKPDAKGDDFLFPLLDNGIDMNKVEYLKKQISSKNALVNKALKMIQVKAKIHIRISFHIARHSFADIARKKTSNIYSISKLLGHSDIKTTEIYLSAFDKEDQDGLLESVIGN